MNFVQSIPRGQQPKFGEGSALRSNRDSDATARQWDKSGVTAATMQQMQQAIGKMQTDVNRIRRRTLPFIPSSSETFYPFKLYQPTNLSDFVGQTCPLSVSYADGGGAFQTCMVTAATTPTNLSAISIPTVSIGDTWRFWAIRSGYVEVRSNYTLAAEVTGALIGNFAMPIVPQYTDFYDLGTPYWSFLFYPDMDTTSPKVPNVIVLGDNQNPSGQLDAVFWIEVQQDASDATLPTAIIKGFVSQPGTSDLQAEFLVSNNGDIAVALLAIGQVPFGGTANFNGNTAINFIFDHARNRYPCGNGNWPSSVGSGTVRNSRGTVNGTLSISSPIISPADLGSQLFYPGDTILMSGWGGGSYPLYIGEYQFTGQTPAFLANDLTTWSYNSSSNPLTDDPSWTLLWWAIQGGTGSGFGSIGYLAPPL